MVVWVKCPYCDELFELEEELERHLAQDHRQHIVAVLIDERLIKALKKAYQENGYDLPETELGWSDVINALLEEKIIEDFGEEALE